MKTVALILYFLLVLKVCAFYKACTNIDHGHNQKGYWLKFPRAYLQFLISNFLSHIKN